MPDGFLAALNKDEPRGINFNFFLFILKYCISGGAHGPLVVLLRFMLVLVVQLFLHVRIWAEFFGKSLADA